jgi:hypothetical protein
MASVLSRLQLDLIANTELVLNAKPPKQADALAVKVGFLCLTKKRINVEFDYLIPKDREVKTAFKRCVWGAIRESAKKMRNAREIKEQSADLTAEIKLLRAWIKEPHKLFTDK